MKPEAPVVGSRATRGKVTGGAGLKALIQKGRGGWTEEGGGEEDYLPQRNGTMGLHQPQGRRERRGRLTVGEGLALKDKANTLC